MVIYKILLHKLGSNVFNTILTAPEELKGIYLVLIVLLPSLLLSCVSSSTQKPLQHILWHNRSALISVGTGYLRLVEGGGMGMSMTSLDCRTTTQCGQKGEKGALTVCEVTIMTHHRSTFLRVHTVSMCPNACSCIQYDFQPWEHQTAFIQSDKVHYTGSSEHRGNR